MDYNASQQSVAWFKDRAVERNLSLEEPYQRRPVWRLKQRCHLIESILLDCPIPEIYVRSSVTAGGEQAYGVVDGQQRIRSVLKFLSLDEADPEDNGFALAKLGRTSPWYRRTFEDLSDNEKRSFYSYQLGVRFLVTDDEREIRDMFTRLNRYSVPLTPQEIRNAYYTGAFVRLSTELADSANFAKGDIFTPAAIRRMADIEFVSELIAGIMFGPQNGSPSSIDNLYDELDAYEDEIPDQAKLRRTFAATLDEIRSMFPDLGGTRWSNKHDFYSLFLVVSFFLTSRKKLGNRKRALARKLNAFAEEVLEYIQDDEAHVSDSATRYARAVQKGPSSKTRRAARHQELIKLLRAFYR